MIEIWCMILGHRFLRIDKTFEDGRTYTLKTPSRFCFRCGATTEERLKLFKEMKK